MSKLKKLVSVVIVTRNRKEVVLACLKSVFQSDYPRLEIILVDNASTDKTCLTVSQNYPKVKLIESKTNLGLNGAKNLGQAKAKGKLVLFLDSDTVVDKKMISELVKITELDEKIGLVCPKMYYYDQKDVLWYAGVNLNLVTSQTANIGCNEKDFGQYDQIKETLFAPTAYLATRSVVGKLKGHEELFFMTYGDTDYGFRARQAGFKVVFCPNAKLWHRLGREENRNSLRALGFNLPMRAYYFARNRVIFMKRHAPKVNFLFFMAFFYPLSIIYFVYKIVIWGGLKRFLKPYLLGVYDGLKFALGFKINNRWQ